MDFKTLLQSMDTISESDSKVHKGTYGTSHGKEDVRDQYGHRIGKVDKDAKDKKEAPKKGRGRPKKGSDDSGEVKKYDTKSLHGVFGGGEKPKKEIGKTSKKHSLKEYIEEVEANQQLDEGGPYDLPGIDYDRPGDIKIKQRPHMAPRSPRHPDDPDFMDPDQRRLRADQERVKKAQDEYHAKKNKDVEEGMTNQEPVTIKPATQTNTQVIQQGNKTLGTVTNPQLAAQIKQSIGKGEMTLNPNDQEMEEAYVPSPSNIYDPYGDEASPEAHKAWQDELNLYKTPGAHPALGAIGMHRAQGVHDRLDKYLAKKQQDVSEEGGEKWIQGAIKHPGALTKKAKAAGMSVSAFAKKHAHDSGTTGKQARLAQTLSKMHHEDDMEESAVEESGLQAYLGNKKYGKDGMDALRKAGQDHASEKKMQDIRAKYSSKEKVSESMQLTESQKEQMNKFFDELELGPKGYNIKPAIELNDKSLATSVINKTLAHGRFKSMAGSYKDQMRDAALEHFGFTSYEESLEEGDLIPHPSKDLHTTHGMDSKPSKFVATPTPGSTPKTKWSIDPIERGTQELSGMGRKAFDFIKGTKESTFESNDMKDIQLENWENQLNGLLTEGITVSTSTGQQGAPDSVSINATEHDAGELMSILRNSGLGVFGGQEQQAPTGYGVVSQGEEEPTGTGTEPETSPAVVGDGDDMLSLIKKMTGIGGEAQPAASSDYEDEEGSEEEHDETCDDCGHSPCSCDDESTDSDKEEVDEADMEEGNMFTGNLAKARAAGKKEADLDGDGDMEKVHEGHDHEECNECGYPMESCECETQVEEGFSNDAGGDAMADTELMKLKALLSMGNDLHKMKQSQAVGNPTKVTMETQLMNDSTNLLTDWKKLSGIK